MEEIKKISINDKNYPKLLREIKDSPKVLYYKGELKSNENCIAIIGSRDCSEQGKQITSEIIQQLIKHGFTIVSGLALGIDTIAHQTTIDENKRTIAVLGTGINYIYPKENIKLAQRILEVGGCIISEYLPKSKGTKYSFPKRDRIISGLSLATIVIEAKLKSGSLITANYAFSQKRKVFAIPNSEAYNYLIKKGAKPLKNIDDFLGEIKCS